VGPSYQRTRQLRTLLPDLSLFKDSLFTPSQEVHIPFNYFLTTSSHPKRGRPAFCWALDGWPKRTIFGNLSSFICRMCPSHLNLSPILALEIRIEPQLLCNLLLEIHSVSWLPKAIRRQSLWKKSYKSSSVFRTAHASEPYLTNVILAASNIIILVCRLIFSFFQTFFNCETTPWAMPI